MRPGRGLDRAAHAREGAGEFAQGLAHEGFVHGVIEAQDVRLVDGAEVAFARPVHVLGAVQGDEGGARHCNVPAALGCISSNGLRSTVQGL